VTTTPQGEKKKVKHYQNGKNEVHACGRGFGSRKKKNALITDFCCQSDLYEYVTRNKGNRQRKESKYKSET